MKTFEEWNKQKGSIVNFLEKGEEIDKKLFEYFLFILPPQFNQNGIFAMGEPYSMTGKGEPTFISFKKKQKRYYYLGILTISELHGEENETCLES